MKTYSFPATIEKVEGIDGAFVQVPLDPSEGVWRRSHQGTRNL